MTIAATLRRSGFTVTAFTNPLECLTAAYADGPDLLISDVIMPELSGIDLAVQIQQACPDCGAMQSLGHVLTAAGRLNTLG